MRKRERERDNKINLNSTRNKTWSTLLHACLPRVSYDTIRCHMIWYDMIVVWSTHGTVSRQHSQLQLEFQVSISSSRFEFFQWRSPGRSQCQWGVLTFKDVQWNSRHSIESAKRILSIWSIHLCLSVGKSLIRPSAVPPFPLLLTSFRNLRYDEIIQAPTGALLRTLWKNVAGWQKKREGVGGTVCHGPKRKKKK